MTKVTVTKKINKVKDMMRTVREPLWNKNKQLFPHFHRSKFSHNGNKYIACDHSCIASACQCSPFDLGCSS